MKGVCMRPVRHLHLGAAFVMSAVLTFAQSGIGPVTRAVPQARHHIAHPPTLTAPQYKLKEIVNVAFAAQPPGLDLVVLRGRLAGNSVRSLGPRQAGGN